MALYAYYAFSRLLSFFAKTHQFRTKNAKTPQSTCKKLRELVLRSPLRLREQRQSREYVLAPFTRQSKRGVPLQIVEDLHHSSIAPCILKSLRIPYNVHGLQIFGMYHLCALHCTNHSIHVCNGVHLYQFGRLLLCDQDREGAGKANRELSRVFPGKVHIGCGKLMGMACMAKSPTGTSGGCRWLGRFPHRQHSHLFW